MPPYIRHVIQCNLPSANLKQFTILYQGPKICQSLIGQTFLTFKTEMQEFLLKGSLSLPSCTFAALSPYVICYC